MLKILLITAVLGISSSFANCIKLDDYPVPGNLRLTESEVSDFNQQKFRIYRSYVLNSDKISQYFTTEIARLYDIGLNDNDLSSRVRDLENQKAIKLADNCRIHKNQLLKLTTDL